LPNQKQARLKSAPVEREINQLGLLVMDLDSQLAESSGVNHGVVVREIISGMNAEAAGMRVGDIITTIDGQQLDSAAQFEKIVDNMKPGKAVPVRIVRNGRAIFIPLKLSK
jgi:serine protease Do